MIDQPTWFGYFCVLCALKAVFDSLFVWLRNFFFVLPMLSMSFVCFEVSGSCIRHTCEAAPIQIGKLTSLVWFLCHAVLEFLLFYFALSWWAHMVRLFLCVACFETCFQRVISNFGIFRLGLEVCLCLTSWWLTSPHDSIISVFCVVWKLSSALYFWLRHFSFGFGSFQKLSAVCFWFNQGCWLEYMSCCCVWPPPCKTWEFFHCLANVIVVFCLFELSGSCIRHTCEAVNARRAREIVISSRHTPKDACVDSGIM